MHDKGILSQQRFLYRDRLLTVEKKKKRTPGIATSQYTTVILKVSISIMVNLNSQHKRRFSKILHVKISKQKTFGITQEIHITTRKHNVINLENHKNELIPTDFHVNALIKLVLYKTKRRHNFVKFQVPLTRSLLKTIN